MRIEGFDALATSYAGVRRRSSEGTPRWQVGGRLVARQLDETHVLLRVPFDVRDLLVRTSPGVFSVPRHLVKHTSVVADLDARGADDVVADAMSSAWRMVGGGAAG